MRTLCFYSYYFFCENGNKHIKRFSNITKEDYETFKSHPHLWKSLNKDYQVILQHYLNSSILEIEEPDVDLHEFEPTGSQAIVPTPLTRANRKAIIDEDAEHVLYELWGYEPEDAPYKVFKRESKTGGVEDILALSKKDILELSCRDDSTSTDIHLSVADAVQVKMLKIKICLFTCMVQDLSAS